MTPLPTDPRLRTDHPPVAADLLGVAVLLEVEEEEEDLLMVGTAVAVNQTKVIQHLEKVARNHLSPQSLQAVVANLHRHLLRMKTLPRKG
jgi:exosome complex RNA-binding protein Rrp42 (RNase PH superfamily)